jgi:hypothetical protein
VAPLAAGSTKRGARSVRPGGSRSAATRLAVKVVVRIVLVAVAALALAAPAAAVDFRGFAIPISCTSMAGAPWWANGVFLDDGTIQLRQSQCDLIDRAVTRTLRDRWDVRDAAAAVFTLAHELSHALGTHDVAVGAAGEDSTEPDCVAWLLYPWVTRTLGITAATTKQLTAVVRDRGTAACTRLAQLPVPARGS